MPIVRADIMKHPVQDMMTGRRVYGELRNRLKKALPSVLPGTSGDIEVNFYPPPLNWDPEGPDIIFWLTTTSPLAPLADKALEAVWMCCGGKSENDELRALSKKHGWECSREESLFTFGIGVSVIDLTIGLPEEHGYSTRDWKRGTETHFGGTVD